MRARHGGSKPDVTQRIETLMRPRAERETGDGERWKESLAAMMSGSILAIDDPARMPL